jgi:hypothetical protein
MVACIFILQYSKHYSMFLKKSVIRLCSFIFLYIDLLLIHSFVDTDKLIHAQKNAFSMFSARIRTFFNAYLTPSLICQTPKGIIYSGRISLRTKLADFLILFESCFAMANLAEKYVPPIEG